MYYATGMNIVDITMPSSNSFHVTQLCNLPDAGTTLALCFPRWPYEGRSSTDATISGKIGILGDLLHAGVAGHQLRGFWSVDPHQ